MFEIRLGKFFLATRGHFDPFSAKKIKISDFIPLGVIFSIEFAMKAGAFSWDFFLFHGIRSNSISLFEKNNDFRENRHFRKIFSKLNFEHNRANFNVYF